MSAHRCDDFFFPLSVCLRSFRCAVDQRGPRTGLGGLLFEGLGAFLCRGLTRELFEEAPVEAFFGGRVFGVGGGRLVVIEHGRGDAEAALGEYVEDGAVAVGELEGVLLDLRAGLGELGVEVLVVLEEQRDAAHLTVERCAGLVSLHLLAVGGGGQQHLEGVFEVFDDDLLFDRRLLEHLAFLRDGFILLRQRWRPFESIAAKRPLLRAAPSFARAGACRGRRRTRWSLRYRFRSFI